MPRDRPRDARPDPATKAREAGFGAMRGHLLYGPLLRRTHPETTEAWGVRASALRRGGLLAVDAHGGLVYGSRTKAEPAQWIWSIAHVLTHLGFGHTDPAHRDRRGTYTPEWNAACCVVVDRFLAALRIPGTPSVPPGLEGDEERLTRRFASTGIPPILATAGPAGPGPDLWEDLFEGRHRGRAPTTVEWGRTFAMGLAAFEAADNPSPRGVTSTTIQLWTGRAPAASPVPLDP